MRPITLERIANNFPDLKLIMAHLGTKAWRDEAAYVLAWCKNVYADLAGSGTFSVLRPMELARLLNWGVTDWDATYRGFRQLMFGTDGKVGALRQFIDGLAAYENFFHQLGVPDDIRHEIMYLNAARMLGLEDE